MDHSRLAHDTVTSTNKGKTAQEQQATAQMAERKIQEWMAANKVKGSQSQNS